MNVSFGSIILWYVFIWQNISPLLRRNTSLTGESYICCCLATICFNSWQHSVSPKGWSKITHCVIGFNSPEISFYHFIPNKSRGIRKRNNNNWHWLKIKFDWKARSRMRILQAQTLAIQVCITTVFVKKEKSVGETTPALRAAISVIM